jgi:RNA polymerase sigma-70 factor (ECF subfamily)
MVQDLEDMTDAPFTDRELIQALRIERRQGFETEKVYETLYRKWEPRIRYYAHRIVGDREEAEDIASIVLGEKLLSNIDTLAASAEQGALNLQAWLYRVTKNHALNVVRNRKKRNTESTDDIAVKCIKKSMREYDDLPAREIFENEAREYVDECLGRLSEEHRTVLVLRYRADLEYKDIAKQLGIKLGTVMSRLSRAKDKLVKQINKADAIEGPYQTRGSDMYAGFSL